MRDDFDRKMERRGSVVPPSTRDALFYVVDTLELCQSAAWSLWGNDATPEHALALYDRVEQLRHLIESGQNPIQEPGADEGES